MTRSNISSRPANFQNPCSEVPSPPGDIRDNPCDTFLRPGVIRVIRAIRVQKNPCQSAWPFSPARRNSCSDEIRREIHGQADQGHVPSEKQIENSNKEKTIIR